MHMIIFAGIWNVEITAFMAERFFSLHSVWLYGWPMTICSSLYFILKPATDLLYWKAVAGLVIGCNTFETNGLTTIYPSL